MSIIEQIKQLAFQLMPTGRAFKGSDGGYLRTLNNALSMGEAKTIRDADATLAAILPDNADFTAQDATDWERRLGLITNEAVALEDRKLAIKRKLCHPGNIPARQHYLYLENQLRAAGFDVYVHENRFDDGSGGLETRDPLTVSGGAGGAQVQHGDIQHGDAQHGGYWTDLIANSVDRSRDANFNVGNNMRFTFFIGGATVGDYAQVDADREQEFRQLVLRIKPAHTVAYLFIVYV